MYMIMSKPYLRNLIDTKFDRPEKTYTDGLQNKKAMKEKLENYERAEDIGDINLDTHVRYITLDKDKKQVFRTGGLLIRKHSKYVKLSNGNLQWSVQRYHYDDDNEEPIFETVFFYRISKILNSVSLNQMVSPTLLDNNSCAIGVAAEIAK